MSQNQFGIKLLKLLSFLLCLSLFWLLMSDICDKYSKQLTTVGITVTGLNSEEKYFPCFTICPWTVFKRPGFYFKEMDFLKNSFSADELFYDGSDFSVFNKTIFDFEEIRTLFLGRCFMACPLAAQTEKVVMTVAMRKVMDIKGNSSKLNFSFFCHRTHGVTCVAS